MACLLEWLSFMVKLKILFHKLAKMHLEYFSVDVLNDTHTVNQAPDCYMPE